MDTYTVTYTDGSKTTFTVVNGADGVQGEKGEKGEIGATGKSAYELYCEQYGYKGTLEDWLGIINSEIFNEYTVVFNLNGGTGGENFVRKLTVRSGHSVALTVPTREGYNFLGWYTGEGVNEAQITADNRVSHNMTLTAKWGIKTSTVTFLDYYGDVISTETVEWGKAAAAPVPPTVTGFYFLKWEKSFDCITESIEVKALYAPITYTVTFNSNGGSSVAAQEVYVGQSPMKPANPTKSGHYFIGWYTDEACTKAYSFNKAFEGDTTVYALFKTAMPIYTAADLRNMANNPSGRYYLANDIDLEGEAWTPIGTFYGTLDGEGHKICNFSMANMAGGNYGFIKTNQGTVKNVTFSDFVVTMSNGNVGAKYGTIAAVNQGKIENCQTVDGALALTASYSSDDGTMHSYYGGIVGENIGTVKNCHVELTSESKAEVYNSYWSSTWVHIEYCMGGIFGTNKGTVDGCTSCFSVQNTSYSSKAKNSSTSLVLLEVGVIGALNYETGMVTNCRSLSDSVIELTVASGNGENTAEVGLGVGMNYGTINNSSSAGTVKDNGGFNYNFGVGGFVSVNNGKMNNCYADTTIISATACNSAKLGGFAGGNTNTITNCYSTGSVQGGNTLAGIGGFVGKNFTGGSISKCFSTTNLTASTRTNVNYFAGACEDGSTAFKCYYGSSVSVKTNGATYTPTEKAAEAKTETELYSEDFLCDTLSWKKDIWNITGTALPTLVYVTK